MLNLAELPTYDPESNYWKTKCLEARKTFDELPITDEAWRVFTQFVEDEYLPAVQLKRGETHTWHENEMPYRFALELWEDGERSTIEIVEKVRTKFKNMGIGVWK